MEDVVAIRYRDAKGDERCVMSWGRLFDAVDPAALLDAVRMHLSSNEISDLCVCDTLREARDFEYFYEAMLQWSARIAASPNRDARWRKKHRKPDRMRRSLYNLGRIGGAGGG
jgi:hypothetical protein